MEYGIVYHLITGNMPPNNEYLNSNSCIYFNTSKINKSSIQSGITTSKYYVYTGSKKSEIANLKSVSVSRLYYFNYYIY